MATAKRVLIVSEHLFPAHATLRRNVAQLLDEGYGVDLVCQADPRRSTDSMRNPSGLRVFQLHLEHRRTGVLRYLFEYFAFFFWSLALCLGLSLRWRYLAVMIDNPPDILAFVSLIAKLRGVRIVLEMFELVPELTAARLKLDWDHPTVRVTRLIERIATSWADHVITVSQANKEVLMRRGVDAGKISIVPNTIPRAGTVERAPLPDAPFVVTHCTLVERYGVQIAIRALSLLKDQWPDLTLRVLGEGEYKAELMRLARELGLEKQVVFRNFVPWSDAMAEIRQAAVGIVAIVADGYGELLLPTKLLEYVEHEVPVACAFLPTIAQHFPPDSLAYFPAGDPAGLAEQIDRLLHHRREALEQTRRAKVAMKGFSWEALAPKYFAALGLDGTLAAQRS